MTLLVQDCLLYESDTVKSDWFQMEIKLLKLKLFKMTQLSLKGFMKNYNLKDDTMNENKFQKFIAILFIPEIL